MLIKKRPAVLFLVLVALIGVVVFGETVIRSAPRKEVCRTLLESNSWSHSHNGQNCLVTAETWLLTYEEMEQIFNCEPKSKLMGYVADGLLVFSVVVGACGGTVTIPFTGGAGYTITVPASVCVGTALTAYILSKLQDEEDIIEKPVGEPYVVARKSESITLVSHSCGGGQ